MAIASFRCSETKTVFEGGKSRRFASFRSVLERKLQMLDAAAALNDLRIPPANHLEALSRDRAGHHSIRVNDQFRLCFRWTADGPADVECVDYHLSRHAPSNRAPDQPSKGPTEMKPKNGMRPIHPGEVLREEFLVPLDMSANKLAAAIDVPANRITEIVAERRNLTADTALRLARVFGTTADFWLNIQKAFELRTAELEIGPSLKAIKPLPLAG